MWYSFHLYFTSYGEFIKRTYIIQIDNIGIYYTPELCHFEITKYSEKSIFSFMKCAFIYRTIHKVCSNNFVVLLLFSSHLCMSFLFLQSTPPLLPLCGNTHTFVSSGQNSDYNTFLQTHTYTHKHTHTHTHTQRHTYTHWNICTRLRVS